MVYVFAVFGILMVESPRPQSVFWVYLLKYVSIVQHIDFA